jgi:hypothetical protein
MVAFTALPIQWYSILSFVLQSKLFDIVDICVHEGFTLWWYKKRDTSVFGFLWEDENSACVGRVGALPLYWMPWHFPANAPSTSVDESLQNLALNSNRREICRSRWLVASLILQAMVVTWMWQGFQQCGCTALALTLRLARIITRTLHELVGFTLL